MFKKALRLLLIASMIEFIYGTAFIFLFGFPWTLIPVAITFGQRTLKRGRRLWAHGVARFAQESDLYRHGMIGGKGLCVGRIEAPKPNLFDVTPALLNPRIGSKEAYERFMRCWAFGNRGPKVRLSKAVHTVICAPTGAGKDAGIIIPYLLECPESMVCIDVKGELALATAEHREKAFGHRIVILDPYKVVTQ